MQNLISTERAKLNLPSAAASDERTINALIGACSDAIRRYCRRHFNVRSYDEVYSGDGCPRLILRAYPVLSVEAVRYGPQTVAEVTNTDAATNQQARVQVTSTGLVLTRVASGVRSADSSLTWASYPTLQGLVTAANALGSGWSARVLGSSTGDYGLWPSQDLYCPPTDGDASHSHGAVNVRGVWAPLSLHTEEVSDYRIDHRGWLWRGDSDQSAAAFHGDIAGWSPGLNNYRVQYTAGFPTIPEAVQEACAEWVAALHYQTTRDPSIRNTASAPSGGTATSTTYEVLAGPPPHVRGLLAPYRRRGV